MTHALPTADGPARPNRKQRRLEQRKARKAGRSGRLSAPLAEAYQHHRAGRLIQAEGLYREVLAETPDDQAALAGLGALCGQNGRTEAAIELLGKALALDPKDASSHVNLGVVQAGLGNLDAADESFRAAAQYDPDNDETQKSFGDWCYRQGRLAEAVEVLRKALRRAPKDAARQATLARSLAGLAKLEEAGEAFRAALALSPEDPAIQGDYGLLLARNGKLGEALEPLALGFARDQVDHDYQVIFAEVLQECRLDRPLPALHRAFLTCLEGERVDLQRMSPAIGEFIWASTMAAARVEDSGDGKTDRVHLDGILADPLLLTFLRKAVCVHLGLEALLVSLRKSLLGGALRDAGALGHARDFMASFAIQCHNNSYVFPYSEPEQQAVESLAAQLAAALSGLTQPDADFEVRLATYAMYHPIHEVPGFEALCALPETAWSAALRPLIRRALLEPREEQGLKAEIPTFGTLDDAVTQAVRSQYEENPYPRWIVLAQQVPMTGAQYLHHHLPHLEFGALTDEGLPCLVAGCGTGRQPIGFSLRLPKAAVTAVDLSRASLAYAKRQAKTYGVDNLRFLHGDLQQVEALDQQFSIIECSGVLHHLEEPERGLRSLLKVLAPNGYLRLSLYSRTAREHINKHRARIKELGLVPDAASLREYRRRMIAGEESGVENFSRINDFFDMDSFRDLLFHVQEHQYSIPEIGELLARHELDFLGFTSLKPRTRRLFAQSNPKPEALTDPAAWADFEADHPDTFLGMYDFWCRPRGTARTRGNE